jgi:tRNA U55 pseudouridine synthase TruB
VRRSTVHDLVLAGYDGETAELELLVSSGTYVRAIADSLGGHCRTLRRLEIGPFSVADADEQRILPAVEALPFLPLESVTAEEAHAIKQGRTRRTDAIRLVHEGELVAVDGTVLP